jgi:hypothetical protein
MHLKHFVALTMLSVVSLGACHHVEPPSTVSVSPIATATASDVAPISMDALPPDSEDVKLALTLAGRYNSDGTQLFDYDTFNYTVMNGDKSRDGYPMYLIECDRETSTCTGEAGQALGSIDDVAAKITVIRNRDVIANGYACDKLCWDPDHHVVGAPSKAMAAWVARHPSYHQ